MQQRPVSPSFAFWRLVWVTAVFVTLYRLSNQLTLGRAPLGAGVFTWERAIPFVDWTVLPYLSICAFFAASFFLDRDRAALDRHSQRLLLALGLSLACYALVPLRFSFERPPSVGLIGWLYEGLAAFDLPCNRAPSLHISVLTILWARFAPCVRGTLRLALAGWFLLIAGSVLTTYQHHVIDIPAGLAVGLFCVMGTAPLRRAVQAAWCASRTSARTASVSSAFRAANPGVVFTE